MAEKDYSVSSFIMHPELYTEEENQHFFDEVGKLSCSPEEWWNETPEESKLNDEMMEQINLRLEFEQIQNTQQ